MNETLDVNFPPDAVIVDSSPDHRARPFHFIQSRDWKDRRIPTS